VEAVGQDFHRHYALRHGVVHWVEAGDWQRVRALCTDLGYLEAKCRETEVSALEEDLSRAARAARGDDSHLLSELFRAVQTQSHWLRRDPGALAQLGYNWLRSSGWTGNHIEEILRFPEGLPALRLRHPVRMSGSEIRTLLGHRGSVYACTVLPDGRRALSASLDETLKLWDLHSGECLQTLYGRGSFFCVAIAGDVIFAGDVLDNVWILEANPRPQKFPARGTLELTEKSVDLGIVIALKEEFRVFQELVSTELRAERDEKTGQYDYTFQLPGSPHRCVVSFIGEMNPEPAALHTERLLSKWNPRTVVMLGIAAGLHSDVRVGDVVIASQVDNYLASAKAQPSTALGSFEFSLGGTVFHGDHDFLSRVRNLEFAHREHFLSWSQRCQESFSKLVPLEARAEPELLDVHLASGPVVGAAQEFTHWLRSSRDRNLKALDMESAGLVASAFKRVNPTRTLVLRGISDYGDERKATLDSLGEGSLRRLAMHNATALLWTLLRTGVLPRATE
jgi:nucleoside phosphorylase